MRDVTITAGKASPGTRVFVGYADTPPNEIALHANDLRHARAEMQEGGGSVHARRRMPTL